MSETNTFTAAAGFGLRVTPARGAFRMRVGRASPELEVEHQHAEVWRSATITPQRGDLAFSLGAHTTTLAEVATVEAGPDLEAWWIETSRYRIPLPALWTVDSSGTGDDGRLFDLLGPEPCSISIQTPRRMRSLEALQGPGQEFRDTGQLDRAAWIEFDYTRDDRPWIQRNELLHRGLTPFVITLQAPVDAIAACIPTLANVVDHIEVIG